MTFPEQKRVFQQIPGLENAQFARYGVMHRNTYIHSPKVLEDTYALKKYPLVSIVGQLSGVEGYVESAASGCYGALSLAQKLKGVSQQKLSRSTMMGAMASYVSNPAIDKFVPMNANFGIFLDVAEGDKQERKKRRVEIALKEVADYYQKLVCTKN